MSDNMSDNWRWGSGKEQKINTMTIKQCLKALLHARKRIRNSSDKVRFWEYKADIARSSAFKTKADKNIEYFTRIKNLFESLLENLNEQVRALGEEPPSCFDETKNMLDNLKDEEIKKKAELINIKESEIDEYF